ncbi:hypothetical protein [Phenylobacterium sp.]|uniref:hypothetical protein n=1 Tax=Phenylobacterium sp. TaxID=1871053 RepID=UPI00289B0C15|nr:hypothetical protein [Phenylobacterium sp.]
MTDNTELQILKGPHVISAQFDYARRRIVLEMDRDCSLAFAPALYGDLSRAAVYTRRARAYWRPPLISSCA